MIEDIRSEIKSIRKEFEEFKVTIRFTSDKYDEISTKMRKIDDEIRAVYCQIEVLNRDVNHEIKALENKQEYIENQSRRNNIKMLGVEEKEDNKNWADTENVVKNLLQTKLKFTEAVEIERAHRIGEKTYQGRHIAKASKSEEHGPRPIIAKSPH